MRLEFDQTEYILGESVPMRFVLENSGDQAFQANLGGDYRGSTRALRFHVTATDASGRMVEDPDLTQMSMGGLSSWHDVKPKENLTSTLELLRYCRILEPGRYTIQGSHDFGWSEGERKRPTGKAVISFRAPSAADAERIVAGIEQRARMAAPGTEEEWRANAETALLHHAAYLEPLARRARAGKRFAVRGVGAVATREATAILIELCGGDDPALALDAALTLNGRLPDPESEGNLPSHGAFNPSGLAERRRIAAAAWDDKFLRPVRERAREFLRAFDAKSISAGAFMMQAVGTGDDGFAVLNALDEALRPMAQPRRGPGANTLDLPSPLPELLRAMQAMRQRGFNVPDGLANEGAVLVYLDWLARAPAPRPARWFELARSFSEKGRFPTREAALRSIPDPFPAACMNMVHARLEDLDPGVCRVACDVAGKSRRPEFIAPLLEIIALEQDEWLLRAASDAAAQLGARYEMLETWATRLAEEAHYEQGLDNLQTVIAGLPNGWSRRHEPTRSERIALRKHWQQFLTVHAAELRAGKKFQLGDPALTPGLFGRARSFQLPDGTAWPVQDLSSQ